MISPTRTLLLRAGRSSVDSCVRAGDLGEPALAATARAVYDRMAAEVPWPTHLANQGYLALMVLPVAALYTALRDGGWARDDAVRTLRAAVLTTGRRQRALFALVLRTDRGRRLLLRSLRSTWLGPTPPPANQWHVTQRSPDRVTIEVRRCYRLEAFRLAGTPEVAAVACAYEQHVLNGSSRLHLTATTMADGADRCRLCFERSAHVEDRHVAHHG